MSKYKGIKIKNLKHPETCEHNWQPVSFRFETQVLDEHGRVVIRQPDLEEGRVYCVCLKCAQHTYVCTSWAGYYLGGSNLREEPS